jgi:hypothetical protein
MSKVRLSASLSLQIQEEKFFVEQWQKCLPRRRQQWLREQIYLAIGSGAEVVSYTKDSHDVDLKDKDASTRIQIELDVRDPKDKAANEIYQSMSKTRRGQWLRNALILGMNISLRGKDGVSRVGEIFVSQTLDAARTSAPDINSEKPASSSTSLDQAVTSAAPPENPAPASLAEKVGPRSSPEIPEGTAEPIVSEIDEEEPKPVHASQLRGLFMQG